MKFACRSWVAVVAACALLLWSGLTVPSPARQPAAVVKTPPAEIPGTLFIAGGGNLPDSVRDKFVELASGPKARLVVIPTASAAADGPGADKSLEPWKKYKLAELTLLHTRDLKKANDDAFVEPMTKATAVWFGGGDQTKLMAAYRVTAVERELHKLLQRGGVIGGTSAGAALMSKVMITGGNPKATVGTGFGFLTHFVIDQHFLKRKREARLLGVLADHPGLAGLGVDEETAVIGNRVSTTQQVGRPKGGWIYSGCPRRAFQATPKNAIFRFAATTRGQRKRR